jgi:hypothetical protein
MSKLKTLPGYDKAREDGENNDNRKEEGMERMKGLNVFTATVFMVLAMILFDSNAIYAHCYILDGPVVKAAKKAPRHW